MTLASTDLGSLGMSAMSVSEAEAANSLRATGLTVRRGERTLFAGLDLSVAPGEVLLLRGPNGVGKSTLLMTLAGIIRPEAGSVEYPAGGESSPLARMHVLNYQHGLKGRLTVHENLAFWRAVNGPTGIEVEAALEATGIGGLGALEAGYLSSGQLRRLALARLLVSKRPIWLLDEPSATLDAEGELLLGRLIEGHRAGGGISVVATHHNLALQPQGVSTLVLRGEA